MSHVRFPPEKRDLLKACAALHSLPVEKYLADLVERDAKAHRVRLIKDKAA